LEGLGAAVDDDDDDGGGGQLGGAAGGKKGCLENQEIPAREFPFLLFVSCSLVSEGERRRKFL
jgi:hypothetical protein